MPPLGGNKQTAIPAPFPKSGSLTACYRHLLLTLPPLRRDAFVAATVCIVAQLIMVAPVIAANIKPPVCYPRTRYARNDCQC